MKLAAAASPAVTEETTCEEPQKSWQSHGKRLLGGGFSIRVFLTVG